MQNEQKTTPYNIFMLLLCIIALILMAIDTISSLNQNSKIILKYADNTICAFFLIDFCINLYNAKQKWKYLSTWGIIDLLSSIPQIDILRTLRITRILRIVRLLRGIKATKILANLILKYRAESVSLAATLISILVITFASISVLQLENSNESNIKSPSDAIWWSVVTLTTVGYGDKYPITTEGRCVGVILMIVGIGLFGTFSGFIASWFLAPQQTKEDNNIVLLRKDIAELKDMLKENINKG